MKTRFAGLMLAALGWPVSLLLVGCNEGGDYPEHRGLPQNISLLVIIHSAACFDRRWVGHVKLHDDW